MEVTCNKQEVKKVSSKSIYGYNITVESIYCKESRELTSDEFFLHGASYFYEGTKEACTGLFSPQAFITPIYSMDTGDTKITNYDINTSFMLSGDKPVHFGIDLIGGEVNNRKWYNKLANHFKSHFNKEIQDRYEVKEVDLTSKLTSKLAAVEPLSACIAIIAFAGSAIGGGILYDLVKGAASKVSGTDKKLKRAEDFYDLDSLNLGDNFKEIRIKNKDKLFNFHYDYTVKINIRKKLICHS